MYADVGLKQTAMNVVLQVLPHPAPETNGLIRELPAGWGCQSWVGSWEGIRPLEVTLHHEGTKEKTEARERKTAAQRESISWYEGCTESSDLWYRKAVSKDPLDV